jgi:lipopolysaccharide export system permease protein
VVFIIIDFVNNIKMWLAKGVEQVAEYYVNYLPYIIYLVSPVAVMLTAIASVGAMAKHLEISAMQGTGKSPFRILLPILVSGIIITALLFVIGEMILPDANYRRLEIMETRIEQRKNPRIKEKNQFVYIGSDHSDWYFRHYNGIAKKGDQVSLVLQNNGKPTARYDAKRIEWSDTSWVLEDGWVRFFAPDGNLTAYKFKTIDIKKQTSVLPEDIINERQSHEEMNVKQINRRIEILRRSGEDTQKMDTQRHFKFSGPITALVTLIIALSLSHKYKRGGSLSHQFGIGIILTFSYYIVIKIGLQMGENENGILKPWLGAWIGHIIYGSVALAMLFRSFRL